MTGSRPQTSDGFAGNAFFFHFFVDRLKNAILINIDKPSPRARVLSESLCARAAEPRVADAAMTTIISNINNIILLLK